MDIDIIEEMKKLKLELYKIQCKNWIPSLGKGKSASGRTLEALLGKEEDTDALPDYNGIELKVKSIYSKYDLHLFCCAPDNKPIELQRLLKFGGYPDKNNPEFKVFQVSINAINKKQVRRFSYQLFVNHKKEVLELRVFYGLSNNIYTKMSWTFKELESRLNHKLKYLAIIPVIKNKLNGKEYFKYRNPSFYRLKNFNTFINLIEEGKIVVTFKLSYYHSGKRYGKFLDRGTNFDIPYNYIADLFEKLEV